MRARTCACADDKPACFETRGSKITVALDWTQFFLGILSISSVRLGEFILAAKSAEKVA